MHDLQRYEEDILPKAIILGEELGVDLQLAEPSGGSPSSLQTRRCFLPWHETWVDIDGSILLCHSHGAQTAGHLRNFHQAWNGSLYRTVRRGLVSGKPFGACDGCGMNFAKQREHEPVPLDPMNFLGNSDANSHVKWSGRMRQFDLRGRRNWSKVDDTSLLQERNDDS